MCELYIDPTTSLLTKEDHDDSLLLLSPCGGKGGRAREQQKIIKTLTISFDDGGVSDSSTNSNDSILSGSLSDDDSSTSQTNNGDDLPLSHHHHPNNKVASFDYKGIVKLVNFLKSKINNNDNNKARNLQKVRLLLSHHKISTNDYIMASYLVNGIHEMILSSIKETNCTKSLSSLFELEVELYLNTTLLEQVAAFFRSTAPFITSLIIITSPSSTTSTAEGITKTIVTTATNILMDEVANALALHTNLRKLKLNNDYNIGGWGGYPTTTVSDTGTTKVHHFTTSNNTISCSSSRTPPRSSSFTTAGAGEILRQVLFLELIRYNKVRLEELQIVSGPSSGRRHHYSSSPGISGIGFFLSSACSSQLQKLDLCFHMDGADGGGGGGGGWKNRTHFLELSTGLAQNTSISELKLVVKHPAVHHLQQLDHSLSSFPGTDDGMGWSSRKHHEEEGGGGAAAVLENWQFLLDFFQEASSVRKLEINDWSGGKFNFFGLLMKSLKVNPNITHLRLDGFPVCHRYDEHGDTKKKKGNGGVIMKEFLMCNQVVESLDLKVQLSHMDDLFFNEEFCLNMAEGFLCNQSVTSFKLKVQLEQERRPDLLLDISSLVDALKDRCSLNNRPLLQELELSISECPITFSSYQSLNAFLSLPSPQPKQQQLKSLNLSLANASSVSICPLIQTINGCPSLQKIALRISLIAAAATAENYTHIYTLALQQSPALTDLSLELQEGPYYNGFKAEEKAEMRKSVLDCIKANTQLEEISLEPLDSDVDNNPGVFYRMKKSFCLRNKATNATTSLSRKTLEPMDLPNVLDSIEEDCNEIGVSTDIYFTNIWFSLIRSRPLEVAKYCPC